MPQPARSITLPRTGVDKRLQQTRRDHRGVHIHLGVGVSASRNSCIGRASGNASHTLASDSAIPMS